VSVSVCLCEGGWLCVCVCASRAKRGSPPPLVSASAVSLTHATSNHITAREEGRRVGKAMLRMALARSDGRRRMCVCVHTKRLCKSKFLHVCGILWEYMMVCLFLIMFTSFTQAGIERELKTDSTDTVMWKRKEMRRYPAYFYS